MSRVKSLESARTRAGALACLLAAAAGPAVAGDEPVVVVVARPAKITWEQRLALPASLAAFEKAPVHAKVTGYLAQVTVDIGDRVKKGQVLARLEVPEMLPEIKLAEAQVAAAAAKVKSMAAEAELAAQVLKRLTDLHAEQPGAVPAQELDVARSKKKVADARVEMARAAVEVEKARLARRRELMKYATLRAPYDGVVTRRRADPGELVTAGTAGSPPILEILRAGKLRLVFHVPELVVPYVKKGQPVTFTLDALPGRILKEPIARLAGALSPATRSMRAELDVDPMKGKLRPGMFASVKFPYKAIPQAVVINAKALHVFEGQPSVYTVKAGKLAKVPVTLLDDNGRQVVVKGTAGELDSSTLVVIEGPRLMRAGQPVKPRLLEKK